MRNRKDTRDDRRGQRADRRRLDDDVGVAHVDEDRGLGGGFSVPVGAGETSTVRYRVRVKW